MTATLTIRTFGKTADIQVTDAKIRETQRDLTTLRARRGEQPCTREQATAIATTVAGQMLIGRIDAKARKMRDRVWRAQIRLAR